MKRRGLDGGPSRSGDDERGSDENNSEKLEFNVVPNRGMDDSYFQDPDLEYEAGVLIAGGARFWEAIRRDLARLKPRHPTPEAIREGLASGKPVPAWAADYIAGRLAGTVKLPRGKPTYSEVARDWRNLPRSAAAIRGEQRPLVRRVRHWKQVFEDPSYALEYQRAHGRRPPKESAYRKALARVADETGIPEDTLDKYCYPRRR